MENGGNISHFLEAVILTTCHPGAEGDRTTSKGERCSHACVDITEPKRLGLAPTIISCIYVWEERSSYILYNN